MTRTGFRQVLCAVAAAATLLSAGLPAARGAEEDTRYRTITLRGRIVFPQKDEPLEGARITLTPVDGGTALMATTDPRGAFELTGIPFTTYSLEIVTRLGEHIRGVSPIPIRSGERAELEMRITKKPISTTSVENTPGRLVFIVQKEPFRLKRFWTEFAIFFGLAAGVGAAAY